MAGSYCRIPVTDGVVCLRCSAGMSSYRPRVSACRCDRSCRDHDFAPSVPRKNPAFRPPRRPRARRRQMRARERKSAAQSARPRDQFAAWQAARAWASHHAGRILRAFSILPARSCRCGAHLGPALASAFFVYEASSLSERRAFLREVHDVYPHDAKAIDTAVTRWQDKRDEAAAQSLNEAGENRHARSSFACSTSRPRAHRS